MGCAVGLDYLEKKGTSDVQLVLKDLRRHRHRHTHNSHASTRQTTNEAMRFNEPTDGTQGFSSIIPPFHRMSASADTASIICRHKSMGELLRATHSCRSPIPLLMTATLARLSR